MDDYEGWWCDWFGDGDPDGEGDGNGENWVDNDSGYEGVLGGNCWGLTPHIIYREG